MNSTPVNSRRVIQVVLLEKSSSGTIERHHSTSLRDVRNEGPRFDAVTMGFFVVEAYRNHIADKFFFVVILLTWLLQRTQKGKRIPLQLHSGCSEPPKEERHELKSSRPNNVHESPDSLRTLAGRNSELFFSFG